MFGGLRTDAAAVAQTSHPYRQLLKQVDDHLAARDLSALKFLCSDLGISPTKLDAVQRGIQLFDLLEPLDLIHDGNVLFVAELMYHIGRLDLVKKLGYQSSQIEGLMSEGGRPIKPYRLALHRLCDDMTTSDFEMAKFMCGDRLSHSEKEYTQDMRSLLVLLQQRALISDDNISFLIHILQNIPRQDLASKLQEIVMPGTKGDVGGNMPQPGNEAAPPSGKFYSEGVQSPHPSYPQSYQPTFYQPSLASPGMSQVEYSQSVSGLSLEQLQQQQQHVEAMMRSHNIQMTDSYAQRPVAQPTLYQDNLGLHMRSPEKCSPSAKQAVPPSVDQRTHVLTSPVTPPSPGQMCMSFKVPSNNTCNTINIMGDHANIAVGNVVRQDILQPQGNKARKPLHKTSSQGSTCVVTQPPSVKSTTRPHRDDPIQTQQAETLTPPAQETTDSLEELGNYKIESNPRGICLIISNLQFKVDPNIKGAVALDDRKGGEKDQEKVLMLFKKLGFIVCIETNLTVAEMSLKIDRVKSERLHSHDCFVCFIMSHGSIGSVYGAGGGSVSVFDLMNPLKSTVCPGLSGKPKLFFIQACQGRKKQTGCPLLHVDGPSENSAFNPVEHTQLIPNDADFLLGFATTPNFVSFRSETHGSWYISKLVEVFNKYHNRYDVLSMMTKVNEEVSKGDAHMDSNIYKQSPAPYHTLRYKVFFKSPETPTHTS